MTTVNVYMQDGRVFHYDVADPIKAREHAHRIICYGWRQVSGGKMEYYPVHQVLKVTFDNPGDYLADLYESQARV